MNRSDIQIVIPMAGAGRRFTDDGYEMPKPFIDVNGKMMIERVLDGLHYEHARYIVIIREHFRHQNADQLATLLAKYPLEFVTVTKLTQGAACTALAARQLIDNQNTVVFADCDNIFSNSHFVQFVKDASIRDLDGSLMTFDSQDARFSFVEVDNNGLAKRTKEKKVISNHAIAGIYLFKKGSAFVSTTIEMLIYGDTVRREYYMSNVYNYLIARGSQIGIYNIDDSNWDCVGTPTQLKTYLAKRS